MDPVLVSCLCGIQTILILFPSISLVDLPAGQAGENSTLTYTVVSNSNPALATASILPAGTLSLAPVAGQTGNTTVTVRATDSVGNTVDDSFVLTVNLTDSYAAWVSRNTFAGGQSGTGQNPDGDAWDNLQEYAFLGDPALSNVTSEAVDAGTTGVAPAARYLTLTFPVRKSTTGLTYAVEANDGLSGSWAELWKSTSGFAQPQVLSALDQTDRTVVTVKDSVALGGRSQRYLRVRIVQD